MALRPGQDVPVLDLVNSQDVIRNDSTSHLLQVHSNESVSALFEQSPDQHGKKCIVFKHYRSPF